MVQTHHGMDHLHKRKRIYQKHEPYPHPNKWKRLLDKMIYPIVMIGPILVIPQILKIYLEKNASSISLITWVLLMIPALGWIAYGLAHKEKAIIFSNVAWFICYIFVIVGAILYG